MTSVPLLSATKIKNKHQTPPDSNDGFCISGKKKKKYKVTQDIYTRDTAYKA